MSEDGLRLEWWEPGQLTPHPANWRTHPPQQIDSYRGIKEKVGWAGALLYNEATGRLIDGHLRRDEAVTDGERVPVLVGSWTEEQEALVLASLDPIAAMAEADESVLGTLLQQVEAESGRALAALAAGGEARLAEILAGLDGDEPPEDPGPQIDRAEELQAKWQVQRGQVWQIGRHRLMCGDSTSAEDVARLMGGEKAILYNTDPPYGCNAGNIGFTAQRDDIEAITKACCFIVYS